MISDEDRRILDEIDREVAEAIRVLRAEHDPGRTCPKEWAWLERRVRARKLLKEIRRRQRKLRDQETRAIKFLNRPF